MEQFVPTFESFTGASALLAGMEDRKNLSVQYGDTGQENEFDPENSMRKSSFNTAEKFNASIRDRKLETYLRDLLASPISISGKRADVESTLTPEEIAVVHANAEANPERWAQYLPLLEEPGEPARSDDPQTLDF